MTTHRQVLKTNLVEHVGVRIFKLGEVNVLFDILVLGPKLGQTAHTVNVMLEGRWR